MNWFDRTIIMLGVFCVLAFCAVTLRNCTVEQQWNQEQAVRCTASGGIWFNGTSPIQVGCYTSIEVQP